MIPVIPHFANECIELLEDSSTITWPDINKKLLIEESINFVIQINGKKRGLIKANRNISENEILKLEIDPKSHAAWTGGKQKILDKGRISKFNKKFQNFKAETKK